MKRPVLVLGAAPRITLAIARSLRRRQIPVVVATASSQEPRLRSAAIEDCYRVPDAEREPGEFVRGLATLIERLRPDMLIPANDTAFAAVIQNYPALANRLMLACPPPGVANRVLDKNLTLEAARKCGIEVPETLLVCNPMEAEEAARQLRFPLIAKPQRKYRDSSIKARRFQDTTELKAFWSRHRNLPQMLLQSYVSGHGAGVEMLMHGGKCLATFQHRRLKEFPYTGGVSVVAAAEAPDSALVEWARNLLRALEWEGVAMVEFKVDSRTGRSVLMEVNGRFWGTLSLPIQAGLDFPFYVWQIAHGEMPSVPGTYEVGARWRWSAGYIHRLHGVLKGALRPGVTGAALRRDLLQSGRDFGWPVRDALWSVSDPMPAILEGMRACKDAVVADLRSLRKRLLPRGARSFLHGYRRLGSPERTTYVTRRLQRLLRLRRDESRRVPAHASNLVFVCYGNIMRSPMCEALFRRSTGDSHESVSVLSAGLNAVAGKAADPRAVKVAEEFGIFLGKHRAQELSDEMVEQADVIFAMDYENEAQLLARYPQASPKVFMLGSYAENSGRQIEIPDPYRGDEAEVRDCYRMLEGCVRNLSREVMVERDRENAGARELSKST